MLDLGADLLEYVSKAVPAVAITVSAHGKS